MPSLIKNGYISWFGDSYDDIDPDFVLIVPALLRFIIDILHAQHTGQIANKIFSILLIS
ncbi:MAG: hypothetical protein ACK2UK_04340 [Candidatus Promineifilaceae bacterium]